MSASTRKALLWLAAAHGAVKMMIGNFQTGPEFQSLLSKADVLLCNVAHSWPEDGNVYKNTEWVVEKFVAWHELMRSRTETYGLSVLCAVSIHAITELYERTRNGRKREMLDQIFPSLESIHEVIGTSHWEAYDEAASVLLELERVAGG